MGWLITTSGVAHNDWLIGYMDHNDYDSYNVAQIGSAWVHDGSGGKGGGVGPAMDFRYQLVGISHAKGLRWGSMPTETPMQTHHILV